MPVINNKRCDSDNMPFVKSIATKPSKIQLNPLAKSVPNGKSGIQFFVALLSPNLNKLPMPPPTKMSR
jgi:hypothetical protein